MRPLKLTLQAFGPYAGKEVIDFTQLENRTMFVVSGKTGSGKTTIFDGICYAIYGKASGEDRNGPELRSHFAKDDVLTEVSLDFSLREKTYRITRSPQQEKKKERGDGYTTISAKAELLLLDNGNEKLLAANIRDVDEKIKEIMLIDSNQFRQILMIPQGEFRKLLTSDSKEKEIILQRLFHTEVYKKVEEKLKEESSELKKQVESQTDERSGFLKRAHYFQNEELKEYLEAGSTNDRLLIPLINEEIAFMSAKLEELNKQRDEKQQKRDQLQQKLFEAEAIITQLKTMEELRLKKNELEGQRDTFSAKEREAQFAKKAALLASQEELCHRLKKDMDQLADFVQQTTQKIAILTENFRLSENELKRQNEMEPQRKEAAESVHQLDRIREDVKAYAGLRQETEKLSQSLDRTKKEHQQIESSMIAAEEERKLLQKQKEELEQRQLTVLEDDHKLGAYEQQMDRLQKYSTHLARVRKMEKEVEDRKAAFIHVEARYRDAKSLVQELEQTWLHSQAAVIATTLKDEQACPVCGSKHHPAPAVSDHEFIPTQQDLTAARDQVNQLEMDKAKEEKRYIESQSTLKTINENGTSLLNDIINLFPDFNEGILSETIHTIEAKQAQLIVKQREEKNKLKQLPVMKDKISMAEKSIEQYQDQKKLLEEQLQQNMIKHTEKKTTLSRMMENIPENLRSWQAFERQYQSEAQKYEELIRQLELAQKQFQEAKEALEKENTRKEEAEKRLVETKVKLADEREIFRENMNKQGFETYVDYTKAKRTEGMIEQLEAECRQFHEELRSVSDRLEEYYKLLKDVKKPDVEGLRQELSSLDQTIKKLQEDHQNVYIKKRENKQIIENVEALNEKIKNLEERYKLIGHLYEISKGQNTYRITFERYVLAAFLDDILQEANVRLAKMTSGRYRMLRKKDRSKGNVQSGLELLVFDQYTGQERHVKTLSGGESFKAALSLALGLADVVQNYAGGVSLETMFIDEGFGTLDPESLDQAIETLIDIQGSGRLVGIISHVPELKERIDAQLEVIATQTGSVTEFCFLT